MSSRITTSTGRQRPVRAAGLALLLVASLAAAGCSAESTGGPAKAQVTADASSAPTFTYVALGDSYTAAPLVPETDASNGCLRSSNNYPALVAAARPDVTLVDVSCSSADSSSMIGVQETGDQAQPPQFDALTEDTDLVTVSLGGNDFDLFATLVGYCPQLRSSDPHGAPCAEKLSSGGSDRLTRELRKIRSHVTAIVQGIRNRAPEARVIVVGYPQILPATGTCPDLLPLADGDVDYARRIVEGLARAVQEAAKATKAEYVDVFRATAGHDICADDPWINGQNTDTEKALAFHPFAAEQRAVADLLLAKL